MNDHLYTAIQAAVQAGKAILEVYHQDFSVDWKADASPLTDADRASDRAIRDLLGTSLPILSEEGRSISYEERAGWNLFWMVDPLDGTKEFIKRNGEFTVNIALIEANKPVLGVVFVPVTGVLYFATKEHGSFRTTIDQGSWPESLSECLSGAEKLEGRQLPEVFTIVASRSHLSEETQAFIDDCRKVHGDIELISRGSSLKLCLVAEGKAHVYPRIAPTMEWDTAAAHAVARFAGCAVLDFHMREELTYNKENLLNPHFLVQR